MPTAVRASILVALLALTFASGATAATGLRSCGDDVLANKHASCAFAGAVHDAYRLDASTGDEKRLVVQSPKTGSDYDVRCVTAGSSVNCKAGTNAYMQFPAEPVADTEASPPADPVPAHTTATAEADPAVVTHEEPTNNMDNNDTTTIILLASLVWLVAWVLPSVLVAMHAGNNGFRFWSFLVVALFVSWPLALFGDVLFGARSPLVRQRVAAAHDERHPTLVA
jgi:hypothetical protein